MRKPSIGKQELELLRFVTDHAPISVGEVTEQYGIPHGLSRSTILTMMERLRKKGRLTREQQEGVYRYQPSVPKSELLKGLVQDFMQRTLDGSLEPLIAYLAEGPKLREDELEQLKAVVKELDARRKGEGNDQ